MEVGIHLPDDGDRPAPAGSPRRAIRAAWLVPIIAGSIAAGYFGATISLSREYR